MKNASWNSYLAQTWSNYLPPIRPYKEELQIIKQQIIGQLTNKSIKPKVLILGSTPELRDILYELDLQPTVIDYKKENYFAMSKLLNNKGIDNFVESNWLDIDYHEEFDIVLSEAAFNVVPCNAIKSLYRIVYNCMKKDGILITKNWVRFSNVCPSLYEIIKDYRLNNKNMEFYSFTCIPLMLCFYDYKSENIAIRTFNSMCNNLYYKDIISEIEWNSISVHNYENVDLNLYIPLIYDFINDIVPFFNIAKVFNIEIAHSEYHPLFILNKNGKHISV